MGFYCARLIMLILKKIQPLLISHILHIHQKCKIMDDSYLSGNWFHYLHKTFKLPVWFNNYESSFQKIIITKAT